MHIYVYTGPATLQKSAKKSALHNNQEEIHREPCLARYLGPGAMTIPKKNEYKEQERALPDFELTSKGPSRTSME